MEGRGGGDMDDTPTGAMRRLTGKPMDPSDAKTKGTDGVQSRKPDTLLVPAESMRKPSQTPVDESLTATGVVAPPRLESAQVKTLLELLATSTAKTNGQEQNRHQQDVMSRTLAAIELAEKNARAREARLEGMLQAVSGVQVCLLTVGALSCLITCDLRVDSVSMNRMMQVFTYDTMDFYVQARKSRLVIRRRRTTR